MPMEKENLHNFILNWGINSGVLDGNGMCQADIDYDPRFDENDEVINIYNVYCRDTVYMNDDNFKDGDI